MSCCCLFSFPNLVKIEKIKNLDTSNVSDFSQMFSGCAMKEIDVSTFNWDNCENTEAMFSDCAFLEKVKLGGGKTTKLKNIQFMFGSCLKLKKVDISQFDLQNVEDASACFENCYVLETVNFGKSRPNLKKINGMFIRCKKIERIDLSHILANHSNVEDLGSIFKECANLKEIRFPSKSFDWRKLNRIDAMLEGSSDVENIFMGDKKTSKEEFIKSLVELITLTDENILDFIKVDYSYYNYENSDAYPQAEVTIKSKNDNYIFNNVSLRFGFRSRSRYSGKLLDGYSQTKIYLSKNGYADKLYYLASDKEKYADEYKIYDVNGTITRKKNIQK